MPWDKYNMATIQSLITDCESLGKELEATKTVAESLKKRVDELVADREESEKRRLELTRIFEEEGWRTPRDIMKKLWEVNGDPIGEAMDKADQEQTVYSTTDLYGIDLGIGLWVKADQPRNSAHYSTENIFLGDLKTAQKIIKIWHKHYPEAVLVPQKIIPESVSPKTLTVPPPNSEMVAKVYPKLLTNEEVVKECTKGPYPWGQDKDYPKILAQDKDKRIQELLESNNQYLEQARKAQKEVFLFKQFIENYICPTGTKVVKHDRTGNEYLLEREVKIKIEEIDLSLKDGWVEGALYRSLGPDGRSYVRTISSFNRSFSDVDLEKKKG